MQPTAQPVTSAPERYYSFDALRGAMMALGIVIHSATAYSTLPDVWWIKDAQTSKWMDAVLLFLHTFRLPAFFVMAGFFAALLVEKRGWQRMIENRMMRLGLPMILGVLLIWTPLQMTSAYFHFAAKGGDTWTLWVNWLQRGSLSEDIEPGHFWFLETLIWVTLLALVFRNWLARLGGKWFERWMGSRLSILLLTLATGATLLISDFGILDTPHDFSPHWHIVAAYGVFYAFGWGMYLHRESLWQMRRFGWKEMLLALLLLVPALSAIEAQLASRGTRVWGAYAATALLSAAMGWLAIYGLIGIFLRRFSTNDRRVRYLSDSAYWMYVMHPVVLLTIQVPMMRFDWNPWAKFVIGIVYALPVLLITYDRLARPTWVGLVLNGKRMERWSRTKVPETGVDTGQLTAAGQMEG